MNGSNYEVRYSYDKLSRLTAEFNGKKDRKYVYTYDSSGNITSKKEYRWSDNALLHTYNYSYGDATWGDLLTGYDGRTITSDTLHLDHPPLCFDTYIFIRTDGMGPELFACFMQFLMGC